jgi:hypothetical protein
MARFIRGPEEPPSVANGHAELTAFSVSPKKWDFGLKSRGEPGGGFGGFSGRTRDESAFPHAVTLELNADDEFVTALVAWFESQGVSVPGRGPHARARVAEGPRRLPERAGILEGELLDEEERELASPDGWEDDDG